LADTGKNKNDMSKFRQNNKNVTVTLTNFQQDVTWVARDS